MRAIIINTALLTVEAVEVASFNEAKALLGLDVVSSSLLARFRGGSIDQVWSDDWPRNPERAFYLAGRTFSGAGGIIIGANEQGETIGTRALLERVREGLVFLRLERDEERASDGHVGTAHCICDGNGAPVQLDLTTH